MTARDYAQAIIKNCAVATLTLRISVDSSIMMPIVGDFRICSFIQVRRTCARFIKELPRGILADILPAEREGRGSEAVHELRNERQLAKRNVLPRKKQHCEQDASSLVLILNCSSESC